MLLFLATAGWTQAAVAGTNPNPEQTGPYAVGHTFLMMNDASRSDRPIAVYVFYPVDPASITSATPKAEYPLDPFNYMGWPNTNSADWEAYGVDAAYQGVQMSSGKPFPLVMFSPGWGCAAWFYMFLLPRLASHGYVVAALTHCSDWTLPLEPFDHIAVTAMNRPPDVSFALTQLLAKNATSGDLLFNALMPDRIAASGHSFGGYASMVLAGGDDNVGEIFNNPDDIAAYGPPPPETFVPNTPDPRIKVIVPLDGSNQCLHFYELARIRTPEMGMGQEWSMLKSLFVDTYGMPDYWASWQAREHAAIQGHPSYRVDVAGAYHSSFTNGCYAAEVLKDKGLVEGENEWFYWTLKDWACTPPLPQDEAFRLVTKYVIAFLQTHLNDMTGYQNILTPGYSITHEPNIEFFVTEKRNPNATDDDWPEFFMYFMHQSAKDQARAFKDPPRMLPVAHPRLKR